MAERTSNEADGFGTMRNEATDVVHRTTHDGDSETSLSVTVIEGIAEAKGVSPVDIEQPLYDVVDPDALDRLFTGESGEDITGRVVFELSEFEVTVWSDGDVVVRRVG